MNEHDRMTDIESRLTYLDDTVEQLNKIIIDQQKTISRLEKVVQKMNEDHVQMKEQLAPDIVDTRPPHY